MYRVFVKRVYDCAGSSCKNITVYLNDNIIPIKTFQDYCHMYLPENTFELLVL